MANPWGANLDTGLPQQIATGSDASCPPATNTPITTGQVVVQSQPGTFYPVADAVVAFLCGATPPTNVTINLTINGGASQFAYNVPPALLVANATVVVSCRLVGTPSNTVFAPPGATVQVNIRPSGQTVTAKGLGSLVWLTLRRGGDY